MEVTAKTKYVRMSPSKARDLARAITGKSVEAAVQLTQFSERKAAFEIGKTLKSAIANAEHNRGLDVDDLYVKSAVVEQGPHLRRFRSGARGMYKPVQRKMCHIKIVLAEKNPTASAQAGAAGEG